MPMCCAFGCTSRVQDGKRLFAIPSSRREAARRNVWMQRIGRADFKATPSTRLCEDHFTEDQYEPIILRDHGIKKLKADAAPSIFQHWSPPPQQQTLPAPRDPPLLSQDCSLSPHASSGSPAVGIQASSLHGGTALLLRGAGHLDCTEDTPPQNGMELLPVADTHQERTEAAPPQSGTEPLPAAAADEEQCSSCLVCSRPVTLMCEFLSNMHIHRVRASRKFVCGHCLQEFTKYDGLMGHITGIGSTLTFKPNVKKSARLPLVIRRRQFPCLQCNAVFETSAARLNHTVTHTAGTQKGPCKALRTSPRTASSAPDKNACKDKFKKRPRPVKILAEDPSEICLEDAPEPAPPSKMIVKVVATSESSLDKKWVKILGPRPSKTSLDVPPAQRRPETRMKKLNNANSVSGKTQLNAFSSLPAHQKRQILLSVYCNRCERQFPTLKHLDKHYWSHHSNLDIPLDLAFEVGSGDVAPAATPCSAGVKWTVCVNTLSRLLEEAARDGEM